MKEKFLWQKLKRALKGHHAQRVECLLTAGKPDVDYCIAGRTGWIELKYFKAWPKRVPLRMPHLTTEQVNWHYHYARNGGVSFFLVQVDQDFLLYRGVDGDKLPNRTRKEHVEAAQGHWRKAMNKQELITELTREE
jgi:hypothetical protein